MTTAEKTKQKTEINKVQYSFVYYLSYGLSNITLVCHIDCDSCSVIYSGR